MNSSTHGVNTSVEVTHVSSHGIWIMVHDQELFLDYEHFPWFSKASLDKILHVTEQSPGHLYWPDLDVDLGLETIEHPERFPLRAK